MHGGVVRRRDLSRPERSVVYELTEYGTELLGSSSNSDDGVRSCWASQSRAKRSPSISLINALRCIFRGEFAWGVRIGYVLRFGESVLQARINDGTLEVVEGPLPSADLMIETGPAERRSRPARSALPKRSPTDTCA